MLFRTTLGLLLAGASIALAACSGESDPAGVAQGSGGAKASSSSSSGSSSTGSSSSGAGGALGPIGGDRPVKVHVPPGYDGSKPVPLVVMLHGYSASSLIEEAYLKVAPLADQHGFLYAHPDGTVDSMKKRFWNATDACCNLYGSTVDDSAYLMSVVDGIKAQYNVDPKRVFFMGHSNGGFMSYRMACDHGDVVAAVASLAGEMWKDPAKCPAKEPVAVLQIQGTADMTVTYTGGTFVHAYPGSEETVKDWVTFDGCSPTADTSSPPLDLETTLAGAETTVTKYASGCKPGGGVELWTIEGGGHIPNISPSFTSDVIDFLLAHPKP